MLRAKAIELCRGELGNGTFRVESQVKQRTTAGGPLQEHSRTSTPLQRADSRPKLLYMPAYASLYMACWEVLDPESFGRAHLEEISLSQPQRPGLREKTERTGPPARPSEARVVGPCLPAARIRRGGVRGSSRNHKGWAGALFPFSMAEHVSLRRCHPAL